MGGKNLSFGNSNKNEESKEDPKLNVTNIPYDIDLLRKHVEITNK
jgi:hypothetical protein